jgi:hypothetical protein
MIPRAESPPNNPADLVAGSSPATTALGQNTFVAPILKHPAASVAAQLAAQRSPTQFRCRPYGPLSRRAHHSPKRLTLKSP